ncbi:prolyl aminopeptidase [Noviherbaspirillum galbum]|uniref:Proline iminopeptidase n=1 Tax=Noviherbaspirillum galbum TaxID=2709383 RepID=A0A6B3SRH0_9BURK|nr:prolyl aminopeptidase [Noviherbaspirillum galbum]NEX63294.1 prolyl aminopeptidase [Noviherbaspirillum galbum]
MFPPIEPYRTGMLPVDDIHTLYWEESGNPSGQPVLFLHGGPGSGASPRHRQFFDPAHYRIVIFDQRGAGRSTPLGEYRNNTTQLLIEDIERLRTLLGIEQWLVFGGSWGSTLSLAYGEAHPERCLGFVLRGIFLCTREETDWFLNGVRWFYPEVHAQFVSMLPPEERGNVLEAYCKLLFSDDPEVFLPAARAWGRYEGSCLYLRPDPVAIEDFGSDAIALGVGRLEAHYFRHGGFFDHDQLIRDIGRIRHLPAVIVQGRYDAVCPPATAFRLHAAWPESRLQVIDDAGHAAYEPGIAAALVDATERFKLTGAF